MEMTERRFPGSDHCRDLMQLLLCSKGWSISLSKGGHKLIAERFGSLRMESYFCSCKWCSSISQSLLGE